MLQYTRFDFDARDIGKEFLAGIPNGVTTCQPLDGRKHGTDVSSGLRLGWIGGSDNHDGWMGNPDSTKNTPAAWGFLVRGAQPRGCPNAIEHRQTFATTGHRPV